MRIVKRTNDTAHVAELQYDDNHERPDRLSPFFNGSGAKLQL
jgi:hypothetical protein